MGTLLAVACALGASRPAPCAPRARIDVPVLEAGTVDAGEMVHHAFTLRNDGDAPLALTVTARAPAAARTDGPVPPGGIGRVAVEIDTLALAAGPSVVPVVVATDDPAAPSLALSIRLNVRHWVVASPGRARWIVVRGGGAVTIPQTLRAVDGQAFRVHRAHSPLAALDVAWPPGEPRATWPLRLTLGPDAAVGPLAGAVEIALEHPRQRRLAIPVSGFVRPIVAVTPSALRVPASAGPWRARLHVRSFAEEPLELHRATTDVAGIALAVEPLEPGRTWRVLVSGAADAAPGRIRLETSSAVEPVVDVAVRAIEAP